MYNNNNIHSSNILKGGKFIGFGGYGCVFNPAIVFPDGKIVNEENSPQYVTKFSAFSNEEFKKCIHIQQKLGVEDSKTIGIFPSELIYFTKTKFENFIEKRQFEFENNMFFFKKNNGNLIKINKCHKIIFDLLKSQKIYITQTKLFDYDLTHYQKKYGEINIIFNDENSELLDYEKEELRKDFLIKVFNLFNELKEKLNLMHSKWVYHLDIKQENIAIKNDKGYFFDWDLSEFYSLDYKKKVFNILYSKMFTDYYIELINDTFFDIKVLRDYFNKNDNYLISDENFKLETILKIIDLWCFCGAFSKIFGTLNQLNNIRYFKYELKSDFLKLKEYVNTQQSLKDINILLVKNLIY